MDNPQVNNRTDYLSRVIEITIRIAVLIFIFGWCFQILSPFLSPVLWGLIIATPHKAQGSGETRGRLPHCYLIVCINHTGVVAGGFIMGGD